MFEPVEQGYKSWLDTSAWFPRGNEKSPLPEYKNTVPLEGGLSVEAINDSSVRFVVDSLGMTHQVLSSEPLGHPRLALHQNHYAAPTSVGTPLGSVDFNIRDNLAASVSSYVDEAWTTSSHPAGLAFRVTQPGCMTARYPAMTIRADGRVAVGGGPTSFGSSLVSMGIYRRGILELPSVDKYEDLVKNPDIPFVNGAIVYAKDLDRVLISEGGSWQAIVTKPALSLFPKPTTWTQVPGWKRQIGEPRRDGVPTSFGPRAPIR